MKVTVKRAYGPYSVGQEIPEMPGSQARDMIALGYVTEMVATSAPKRPIAQGLLGGLRPNAGRGNRR